MPYSCPQCLWTIAEPICPGCNQFLTDDMALVESYMRPPDDPRREIEWCTAFGHWGDVFVCCGVMQRLMRYTGQSKVNVLYVGPDLGIVDWLRQQSFVAEVIGIKITNATEGTYSKFWQVTARPNTEPDDWLPFLKGQVEYLPKWYKYVQTHINFAWFKTRDGMQVQLWHGGKLPASAHKWAHDTLCERVGERTGPLIHLHPVSTWSEAAKNHWPHWTDAITWLLANTPHTFVLTGQEPIPGLPRSERLVDLIGLTPTNLEVLAVSEACGAVISTPNNVALWSVIQRQKALVVGNKSTQFLTSYYRRFLQSGERLTWLNVDAPFEKFTEAVGTWI